MDPKAFGDQPASPYSMMAETVQVKPTQHPGLSKREFFAGMALIGVSGNATLTADEAAERASAISNALVNKLAQRAAAGGA